MKNNHITIFFILTIMSIPCFGQYSDQYLLKKYWSCRVIVTFANGSSPSNMVCATSIGLNEANANKIKIKKKEQRLKDGKVGTKVLIGFLILFLILLSCIFLYLCIAMAIYAFPDSSYVLSLLVFTLVSSAVLFIFIRKLYKKTT